MSQNKPTAENAEQLARALELNKMRTDFYVEGIKRQRDEALDEVATAYAEIKTQKHLLDKANADAAERNSRIVTLTAQNRTLTHDLAAANARIAELTEQVEALSAPKPRAKSPSVKKRQRADSSN